MNMPINTQLLLASAANHWRFLQFAITYAAPVALALLLLPLPTTAGENSHIPSGCGLHTISKYDEKQKAALTAEWLSEWLSPSNHDAELAALRSLFGDPPIFPGFRPSDDVKALLIKRRLNYNHWECRRWAVNGLERFVSDGDDPELLLPIFRDALNDPHPEVRGEAIAALGSALIVIENGGPLLAEPWDAATKKRIAEHCDELIDIIIDLGITKALTDENEEVLDQAILLIQSPEAPPRKSWLRALDRVLAKEAIRFPAYLNHVKNVRAEWHRKIHGVEEPEPDTGQDEVDPFCG